MLSWPPTHTLNRVDEDASAVTFEEWDPTESVDSSQIPVSTNSSQLRAAMIMISSKLRATGFNPQGFGPRRAIWNRAVQGSASLRVWVPNVSYYQWIETLGWSYDVRGLPRWSGLSWEVWLLFFIKIVHWNRMGPDGKPRFVLISGQTNFDPESDDTLNGRTVAKTFVTVPGTSRADQFFFFGDLRSRDVLVTQWLWIPKSRAKKKDTTTNDCENLSQKFLKMKKISTMTSRF